MPAGEWKQRLREQGIHHATYRAAQSRVPLKFYRENGQWYYALKETRPLSQDAK
jgi:hypothetical protein